MLDFDYFLKFIVSIFSYLFKMEESVMRKEKYCLKIYNLFCGYYNFE